MPSMSKEKKSGEGKGRKFVLHSAGSISVSFKFPKLRHRRTPKRSSITSLVLNHHET